MRQLVTESLLLSAIAAGVGLALAHWTLRGIVAIAPAGLLRLQEAAIDGRVMLFAAALTAATAVVFGLIPALQFSKQGRDVLRERQPDSVRGALRRGLVAGEVAIALVLLVGAGLLVKSFGRLLAVDAGFSSQGVVMVQLFAWDRHGGPDRLRTFFKSTLDQLQVLPGVRPPARCRRCPSRCRTSTSGACSTLSVGRQRRPPSSAARLSASRRPGISARCRFRCVRVACSKTAIRRLLRWWQSSVRDCGGAMARESPVGRRIRISWQGKPVEAEVVGVVSQVRHDGLDTAPRPEIFLSMLQFPFGSMTFVVRGAGDPAALIDRVKRQIWAIDAMQPVYDSASVDRLVQASVVRQRFSMSVMSAFALVALLLCASGIYGIISFTTTQRTREIGVRMALGADGPTIRRMVLREAGTVVLIGLVAGIAGAVAASPFCGRCSSKFGLVIR